MSFNSVGFWETDRVHREADRRQAVRRAFLEVLYSDWLLRSSAGRQDSLPHRWKLLLDEVERLRQSGTQEIPSFSDHQPHPYEVERLDFSDTDFGDAHAAQIADFLHLRDLNAQGTRITDSGLSHLTSLKNLRSLDLSRTAATDHGLTHISKIRSLNTLNLSNTRVLGPGLKHLGGMPQLFHLNLTGTRVGFVNLLRVAGRSRVEVDSRAARLAYDPLHAMAGVLRDRLGSKRY